MFAGYVPATDLVRGVVEARRPRLRGHATTSEPLCRACTRPGDLRVKNLRQVVTRHRRRCDCRRWNWSVTLQTDRRENRLVPPRSLLPAYEEVEGQGRPSAASAADTTPAPAPTPNAAPIAAAAASAAKKPGELFSAAVKQQLGVVFGRMTRPVTLALELDGTPLSAELQGVSSARWLRCPAAS